MCSSSGNNNEIVTREKQNKHRERERQRERGGGRIARERDHSLGGQRRETIQNLNGPCCVKKGGTLTTIVFPEPSLMDGMPGG